MKHLKPIIGSDLRDGGIEVLREGRENETVINGWQLRGVQAEGEEFVHLLVRGMRFSNCQVWNCSFRWTEFSDVVFENCDFSGCDFSDGDFDRVEFVSCKAVGAKFAGSRMAHVTVTESNFNYANFDQCVLKSVVFDKVEINSGNFAQCRCKEIIWKEAGLTNASFFKTPLSGMDFRDSVIEGLVLSDELSEVDGAVVDIYQAAGLAKRLGLVIK